VITAAFTAFRSVGSDGNVATRAPSFWLVLMAALVLSSAFQRWFGYAPRRALGAGIALIGLLALEAIAALLFASWSRRRGWGPTHALAAATGAILTYGWISLWRLVAAGGTALGVPATPIDVVGQAALLLLMLGLSYVGSRRLNR
jgi:hypothetical protein